MLSQETFHINQRTSDSAIIEQLDILMSSWYAKMADYHENSQSPMLEKELLYEDSDSIMIHRLQALTNQTVFPMVFNDEIRSYINMYTRRTRSISLLLGLAKYYFPMFEETLAKYGCPLELK